VKMTLDEKQARGDDNRLYGKISHMARGDEQSEVLMTLPDGQVLCATVPLTEAEDLSEGADVTAYFNADRVIIATLC